MHCRQLETLPALHELRLLLPSVSNGAYKALNSTSLMILCSVYKRLNAQHLSDVPFFMVIPGIISLVKKILRYKHLPHKLPFHHSNCLIVRPAHLT